MTSTCIASGMPIAAVIAMIPLAPEAAAQDRADSTIGPAGETPPPAAAEEIPCTDS